MATEYIVLGLVVLVVVGTFFIKGKKNSTGRGSDEITTRPGRDDF